MKEIPADIRDYHQQLDPDSRATCEVLLEAIERELHDADRKVWHAHPVWFYDGNPVVGYDRLKSAVRILFWSGQSFASEGLKPEGSFKAAEARYTSADQVDRDALSRWLSEARERQWNYRDIRKNKGLVPLRGIDSEVRTQASS